MLLQRQVRPQAPLPKRAPVLIRPCGTRARPQQQQQQKQQQHLPKWPAAAVGGGGSGAAAAADMPQGRGGGNLVGSAVDALAAYIGRVKGMWRRFLPMLTLFFLLSFVNTILDSLKDTLVITAPGGGAACIPYLTVYAVLPSSVLFLLLYGFASTRMGRGALFNVIVGSFAVFFAVFAWFVMPNADALHAHALADALQAALPAGFAGGIGMLRNWTYTLFFCASELWGDICMGLLFWGLANDTTSLEDAPTLYPLFGLGANLAQAAGGLVLKATTAAGGGSGGGGGGGGGAAAAGRFCHEVQAALAAVLVFAALAAALHTKIHATARRPAHPADLPPPPPHNKTASQHKAQQRAARAHTGSTDAPAGVAAGADDNGSSQNSIGQGDSSGGSNNSSKKPTGLLESAKVLAASLEIRCLAVMTLGHGLTTSLMELCWKHHMRLLLPSPSEFTAFLGDVAVATGGTTALLMLLSPLFFERLGWRGVASATPQILLYGGTAFFAACLAYQTFFGGTAAAAAATAAGAGRALLTTVVLGGALLYVFSKGAKFSLFKPAEEMVYITLNEDGRTRGKAAIDVVGSQAGKSGGSLLQQALLLASAGALSGPTTLPLMFAVYWAMLRAWNASVHELSSRRRYTITSPLATPLTSLDESDGGSGGTISSSSSRDDGGGDGSGTAWGASSANGKTIVAAPPRPAEIGSGLPPSAAASPPGGDGAGGGGPQAKLGHF